MYTISNLAIIIIPRWVKFITVVILLMLTLLYLGMSVFGIYDSSRPGWIEAGTHILGIILPFILIALILAFSESGVDALLRRNADFLCRTIPHLTVMMGDPVDPPIDPTKQVPRDAPRPDVTVQCARNLSIANNHVIITPEFAQALDLYPRTRHLHFRIELNCLKANVNVMIPPGSVSQIGTLFPHTIDGATKEGYWFAPKAINREIQGVTMDAIVAVVKLDEDFMTNPVKRLQFGQDLMLMLRSMVHERPDLFEPFEPATP